MTLVISSPDGPGLKQQWRQQLASQLRRRAAQGPRPLAAITFLVRGPVRSGLVNLRDLLFVVVHDDLREDGTLHVRFAAYGAGTIPWGIKVGPENSKLDKDLALTPGPSTRGRRFDLLKGDLLSLALNLDQLLERHSRYPHLPRRCQPRWPKLWAGFTPDVARTLSFAGPEYEASLGKNDNPAAQPPIPSILGLTLMPLSYVSHAWRQISAVFADLATIPKRQVIVLESHSRNLRGYQGAVEYDLTSSRFAVESARKRRPKTSRRYRLVTTLS